MKKLLVRFCAISLIIVLLFSNIAGAEYEHVCDLKLNEVNNYEAVNDTYHKIVSTTLCYVCECGESKVETVDVSTQYESKHKFDSNNVCYTCGYKREIEIHEHDWENEIEDNNYEAVNDTYHKIVSTTLYYTCECGESKVETIDVSTQYESKHNFNRNNVCGTCGYEREIEIHEHDWEIEIEDNNYEAVNDTYHKIVSTTLYYTCECGESKVETVDVSTQYESKHNFNSDNVCGTCGYEREIEIHEHDWEIEIEDNNYEAVNDTYHKIVSTTLYYTCECGESKVETVDVPTQYESKHNFNSDNVCATCGYEREIHEHNWKNENTVDNYVIVNDTYHKIVSTTLYYICGCGESWDETQSVDGYNNEHNFNGDNVCSTCGYLRVVDITPEPTEIITVTSAPIIIETPIVTVEPTATATSLTTVAPTATLVPIVTIVPSVTLTPIATAIPTIEPTEIPEQEICICDYYDSHWYGVYNYYDENTHTRHHVITEICKKCGNKNKKSNTLEYVSHEFENNVCIRCKYEKKKTCMPCVYSNTDLYGEYSYYDESWHTRHHSIKLKCTICGNEKEKEELEYTFHEFENNICTKCKYETSLEKINSIFIEKEIAELTSIINIVIKLKENEQISSRYCSAIATIASNKLNEYYQVRKGEKSVSDVTPWREISELTEIWYRKSETENYYIPKEDNDITINLAKPDNKWYYLSGDDGEQILFGNFSDKVTIKGIAGQIIVGEIPFVGTAADIRDITADVANWEWSLDHVGTTILDVIGLVPVLGSLKYVDEASILAKGVKLSDEAGEALTVAVKHLDNVSDTSKKSDELGEVVAEALSKHSDKVDKATEVVVKKFDDLLGRVEHPEYFKEGALEHIFKGNTSGGFHYEGLSDANGKVVKIVTPPDENGVYEAVVEINGKTKSHTSTFFPKDWTPEQVTDAIEEVYINAQDSGIKSGVHEFVTSFGIDIRIILNNNAEIISAYPIM